MAAETKPAGIDTVTNNQLINHIFHPGAVTANDAHQNNLILKAFFDKCFQLWRAPGWRVQDDLLCVLHIESNTIVEIITAFGVGIKR